MPGNRFTFPVERKANVAEKGLWRGCAFGSGGKVMAIAGKSLHFPGGKEGECGREGPLEGVCIRDEGESDGNCRKIASLSRWEEMWMWLKRSAEGVDGGMAEKVRKKCTDFAGFRGTLVWDEKGCGTRIGTRRACGGGGEGTWRKRAGRSVPIMRDFGTLW